MTVGTDGKGTEEIAAVVRCDYLEKNESGKNLPQLIEDYGGVKRASKFDTDVINVYLPVFGMASIAFVDEDYIILTKNEDWLEKMVRLYADGKGDTPGYWDIMDYQFMYDGYRPTSYSAYERSMLGWLPIIPLTENGAYTLMPLDAMAPEGSMQAACVVIP